MKLRFYARGTDLVYDPRVPRAYQQRPHYVGRDFVPGSKGVGAQHPATKEPFEIDDSEPGAEHLIRLTFIDSSLWPADEATAKRCNVAFVPVELRNGVYVAKDQAQLEKAAAPKAAKASEQGNS